MTVGRLTIDALRLDDKDAPLEERVRRLEDAVLGLLSILEDAGLHPAPGESHSQASSVT